MKNSNDTIRNRTRNLPACSTVAQTTAPPRAPLHCSTISNSLFLIIQSFDTIPLDFLTATLTTYNVNKGHFYHICYQLLAVILRPSLQPQCSQFRYNVIVAFLGNLHYIKLRNKYRDKSEKKRNGSLIQTFIFTPVTEIVYQPTNTLLRKFALHKQRSPVDQSRSRK
jgi:hypothetical protein